VGTGLPLLGAAAARGWRSLSALAAGAASPPAGEGPPPFGGSSGCLGEAGCHGRGRLCAALPVWVAFGLYLVIFLGE
jgi:hypothetical protein